MNSPHLQEEEIQQYALMNNNFPPALESHLESCAECLAEVENYRLLFSGLGQQTPPVFDFDLAAAVMTQLPQGHSKRSADNFIAGFLVIFSIGCIALPLYFFRKGIASLFIDIPPFFIYAIVISTSLILVTKMLSLYKKYQHQMRFLNFN
jgi:hypothetical protein